MDHTILDSKLVVSYSRSRTSILQLQEVHGVGNVVYSLPSIQISQCRPSNIFKVNIYNLSKDRFYEMEVQTVLIESNYDCEMDIYEELENISDADIVLIIGGNISSLFSVLDKNFILYKWEINYYLRENNLEHRIANTEQELMQLLYSDTRDIEVHNKYRSILASYLPLYRYLELGTEKRDIFYVDKSLYSDSSILNLLGDIFSVDGANARNGVYLDIAVVRTFHLYKRPHLYPWVGILEISDLEDVRSFLLSETFRLCESFCLGLVTFSQSIANIIDKRVPTLVLSRLVKAEGKTWDYSKWLEKPTVASIDSSGKCIILELATGTKTISTQVEECLSTSVLVLTNKTEPYLGVLTLALGKCTPIVLTNRHVFASHFSIEYPLLLPRLNYSALKLGLTSELVKQGYEWVCSGRKMYSIESVIRRISSSRIGSLVRSLLDYSRSH